MAGVDRIVAGGVKAEEKTPLIRQLSRRSSTNGAESHWGEEYDDELNSKEIKAEFITKVYTILSAQCFLLFGGIALFGFVASLRTWWLTAIQPNVAIMWGCFGLSIALLCVLAFKKDQYPINFFLLFFFTLFETVDILFVSVPMSEKDPGAVVSAVGTTAVIFLTLTLYACYSKRDFSFLGGFLICALVANILLGIVCWFAHWPMMTFLYHVMGVLIFSGFILYDTDQIVNKIELTEVDTGTAIWGAIELFLDILNLLLHLMALFGGRD